MTIRFRCHLISLQARTFERLGTVDTLSYWLVQLSTSVKRWVKTQVFDGLVVSVVDCISCLRHYWQVIITSLIFKEKTLSVRRLTRVNKTYGPKYRWTNMAFMKLKKKTINEYVSNRRRIVLCVPFCFCLV